MQTRLTPNKCVQITDFLYISTHITDKFFETETFFGKDL